MESAAYETGLVDAPPTSTRLYSVPETKPTVHQELATQLDSAVEFADFCAFLTQDRVADRAEQLASLAQALYEETVEELRRSGPQA